MKKKVISLFYEELIQTSKNKYEQINWEMWKGYERQFIEKQMKIGNNVQKDVSFLLIKDMKIWTTVRCHFHLSDWQKSKHFGNIQC